MIKVAICDMDMLFRKFVGLLCEKIFRELHMDCQVRQYSSGEDLLADEYPDILILGVKLRRMSGVTVKEILEEIHSDTKILFVSENRNYMSEAFGKNVYGFLNRPIKEILFCEIMEKMVSDIQYQRQMIFCNCDGEIHKIGFKDIVYVEVAGRKTKIYVKTIIYVVVVI